MAVCIRLEWAEQPNISPCAIGEPANYYNMRVNAIYDDGRKETIKVTGKMFNESNLQTKGMSRKSFIVFEGQRLPVTIPIRNCELDHIVAIPKENMVCKENEWLDRSQLIVYAYYTDGTKKEISHYKLTPYAPFVADQKDITIRYGRCRATIDIVVQSTTDAYQESTIGVESPTPSPEHYANTEESQATETEAQGMAQSAVLSSIISPAVRPTVLPQPILKAVSVATLPSVQSYLQGDKSVDLSGGILNLHYSDGHIEQTVMTADGEIRILSDVVGRSFISFLHKGKPVSFPVNIEPPIIKEISIKKLPDKTHYQDGDILDLSGLELNVTYKCGIRRVLSNLKIENYPVTSEAVKGGLTLSLGEADFTLPIVVEEQRSSPVTVGIELFHGPAKSSYELGTTTIDMDGARLAVHKSDGTTEYIPVTSDMILPVDLTRLGKVTVQIVYEGFEVLCPIYIEPQQQNNTTKIVVAKSSQPSEEIKEATSPQRNVDQYPFYPSTFVFRFEC